MSVYTKIEPAQLQAFLKGYNIGNAVELTGIAAGIENSNYALRTTRGEFILTLFEHIAVPEIDYFLQLLITLRAGGFLSPQPQADKTGQFRHTLAGKPAALFVRLAGQSVIHPSLIHCAAVGTALAQLHRYCQTIRRFAPTPNTLTGCWHRYEKLTTKLSAADNALIQTELDFQTTVTLALPEGLIHGDLFRDNLLFVGDKLSGILDFYSTSQDAWLLDIAITANDWCVEKGVFKVAKLRQLLDSYQHERPLTVNEQQSLLPMLRLSALRFWLSRLEYQFFSPKSQLPVSKDPQVFRDLLITHRSTNFSV